MYYVLKKTKNELYKYLKLKNKYLLNSTIPKEALKSSVH